MMEYFNSENNEAYEHNEIMTEITKVLPDREVLKKMSAYLMQKKLEAMRYGFKEDEEKIARLSFLVFKRLSDVQRHYPF